jgi:hypothetical protein
MKGLDFRDPVEDRKQNKEIAKSDTITVYTYTLPIRHVKCHSRKIN